MSEFSRMLWKDHRLAVLSLLAGLAMIVLDACSHSKEPNPVGPLLVNAFTIYLNTRRKL